MFEYIKGNLAEITPSNAVVEAYGIGYNLNISVNTYSKIHQKKEVILYLHHVVREDAELLFAFADKVERDLFRLLIGVSGVGPNTARIMLSSLTPAEVATAIATDDLNRIKSVKGIGLKTAQRVLLDLKGKVDGDMAGGGALSGVGSVARDEAQSALITLGFAKPNVEKALDAILKDDASLKVEDIIKAALKRL
ncbi:Holliday junction branch migration protein RuvA [uncultured Acetobacteroides sp.]|uniref:Holliday junction branch migration protein RuvA n=1 Tax=uncultured Acetobacteroides sp. TaxID=1760811 RepID=UPI0029F5972D|nr:Holliday junction branch migration protein RuvA [uncultured Acetobacteroides sp.]